MRVYTWLAAAAAVAGWGGGASAALVELRYLLTGDLIASWGSVGAVSPGVEETLEFTHEVSGMELSGVVRWRNGPDPIGDTLLLRLEQFRMTSGNHPTFSTPLTLTITEEFIPSAGLFVANRIEQEISGQAAFNRTGQRITLSQQTMHEGFALASPLIVRNAPPLSPVSLRSDADSHDLLPIDGRYQMQTRFGMTLGAAGQEFTMTLSNAQTYAVLVPEPGCVAMLGALGLRAGRRRRP